LLERRVVEGFAEIGDGLPDGVVHQDGAAGDPLMKLGRDETWLLIRPAGVFLKNIHEHDRRLVGLELVEDGDVRVQGL